MAPGFSPQGFDFENAYVDDYMPGFRVLLERIIVDDWLFTLRRGLYDGGSWLLTARSYLDESERSLRELADAQHPGQQAVEFYRMLFSLNSNPNFNAAPLFQRMSQYKSETPAREKPKIAELLDDTPNNSSSKSDVAARPNDDSIFWQTLASVHIAHPK